MVSGFDGDLTQADFYHDRHIGPKRIGAGTPLSATRTTNLSTKI